MEEEFSVPIYYFSLANEVLYDYVWVNISKTPRFRYLCGGHEYYIGDGQKTLNMKRRILVRIGDLKRSLGQEVDLVGIVGDEWRSEEEFSAPI